MNAKMPVLKQAFESAGFTGVKTVISSGNVVFDHPGAPVDELESQAEAAMTAIMGKCFGTYVRPVEHLRRLLERAPFDPYPLPPEAKRLVGFLKRPQEGALELPIHRDGASILELDGVEVLCAYVPNPQGVLFMPLLEKTFTKQITTRTVDTVRKCVNA